MVLFSDKSSKGHKTTKPARTNSTQEDLSAKEAGVDSSSLARLLGLMRVNKSLIMGACLLKTIVNSFSS